MKRKILMIVLALAAVFLVSCIDMALATTVQYDFASAGGECFVDVPGQTAVYVEAWHMSGSYYHGSADRIMVNTLTSTDGYGNNPMRQAFSVKLSSLGDGITEHLVKPWQIGIFKIGKTSVVYWTVPLVTPEVTVPPGMLVFGEQGGLLHAQVPVTPIATGWTYSFDSYYHNAHVTFVCPGWHFCGTVGANPPVPVLAAHSFVSQTWTWTGP